MTNSLPSLTLDQILDLLPSDYWRHCIERRGYVVGERGCWLLNGEPNSRGYMLLKVQVGGRWRTIQAHRASHTGWVGPIPEGFDVDHLCRVHNCVNPTHLEAVPHRVNALRGESPSAVAWRTDMCGSGQHILTGENVIQSATGHRTCRACRQAWDRDYRRRRRQELKAQTAA